MSTMNRRGTPPLPPKVEAFLDAHEEYVLGALRWEKITYAALAERLGVEEGAVRAWRDRVGSTRSSRIRRGRQRERRLARIPGIGEKLPE